jgi:hypothetical protein
MFFQGYDGHCAIVCVGSDATSAIAIVATREDRVTVAFMIGSSVVSRRGLADAGPQGEVLSRL